MFASLLAQGRLPVFLNTLSRNDQNLRAGVLLETRVERLESFVKAPLTTQILGLACDRFDGCSNAQLLGFRGNGNAQIARIHRTGEIGLEFRRQLLGSLNLALRHGVPRFVEGLARQPRASLIGE